MTVITSLGTAMMPRIANLFKNEKHDEIRIYMQNSIKFVLVLAIPFTFGIMAIAKGFVPWFFGSGYEKVVPNMEIIAPIIIFIGMSTVTGTQYLLPLGRQKEYTVSVVIGCIVNVCLNALLISFFKSIGAAIATFLAELIILLIQLYFVRKEFDLKIIFLQFVKYLIFGLIMYGSVKLVSNTIGVSIVNTFIEIVVGGIIYILLLVVSKDSIIKMGVNMTKNKLNNK